MLLVVKAAGTRPAAPPRRELFGEAADFLREGLDVTLNFHVTTGSDAPVTGEVCAPGWHVVRLGLLEEAPRAGEARLAMPASFSCSVAVGHVRSTPFVPP